MHFSLNANQLDDLVILLMPNTLQNLLFVLHVIQFKDFWFLLSHSSLLGRLGLACGTFLRSPLLGARHELNVAANNALDERCKPDTWKWRHERVREEERHLTTMVWKTWKEWCRRDATSLCTELATHSGRIASGDVNQIVWTNVSRRSL